MKRMLTALIALMLAVLPLSGLAEEEEGVTGAWEMTKYVVEGQVYTNPRAKGARKTVVFNEDGTASVTINSNVYYGTWTQEGDVIRLLYEDGDKAAFTVEPDQLVYKPAGQEQYFTRQLVYAEEGSFAYRVRDDFSAEIIGYSGNEAVLNIPEKLGGYPVRTIGASAFASNGGLVSVSIPRNVENIRNFAFYGCGKLAQVKLPEGVKQIGASAFQDCVSLTSVRLPEGLSDVAPGLFSGCKKLSAVVIPSSAKSIGLLAFRNCESLTRVDVPEGVTVLADGAFMGCSSLAEASLPASLTAISGAPFTGCARQLRLAVPGGSYAAQYFSQKK